MRYKLEIRALVLDFKITGRAWLGKRDYLLKSTSHNICYQGK